LESIDTKLKLLRSGANWLIFTSVLLGAALLVQLYVLIVPPWLFFSILAGWALYLVVAIGVATGREKAYPTALLLSIATLAVSLPQPEHYSLAEAGATLASLTFIAGSLLQMGVILLVASLLILRRRQSHVRMTPVQRIAKMRPIKAHATQRPNSDHFLRVADAASECWSTSPS